MSKSFLIRLLIGISMIGLTSCATDSENTSNDLKQEIEEGVLDMLFQTEETPCSDEELSIMTAADTGNFEVVMEYLKNGGDPMLECQADGTAAMTYYTNSIAIAIQLSDSTELIKYYLNLDISQEVKNDYLQFFLKKRDSELVPYLIEGNAHFPKLMKCCPFCLNDFKFAVEHGYDLNWKDPKSGYSLFLSYVGCPSEEYVEANIEVLQYLIDQGADIHQVSDKGQNALDIAVNEDIIAFLKPLYE